MSNLIKPIDSATLSSVLLGGDLSKLDDAQLISYIGQVCASVGVNPITRPFQLMKLNGKLVLYATRDCTDQIRKIHKVSIKITAREHINGVYVVTAQASLPDGRCDESTGAVTTDRLSGDALANAYLKCETKAKRRVTLSICGLGLLDETEIETIKDAVKVEAPQSVRMPIVTLKDIEQEHNKELQKALKEDMNRAEKSKVDVHGFRVPNAYQDNGAINYGEYVPTIGKLGGPIIGVKIKDIDPNVLMDCLKNLRSKTPAYDLTLQRVQEFIAHAEGYINDQKQKKSES